MANGVFNIAKGRVVEYYNRVKSNDPAAGRFIVTLWTGAGTDATLKDLDSISLIEADGGFAESVDASYVRKILTDVELAALPAPDDTGDKYDVAVPDQTWTALTGESLTRLIIGYDASGSGPDSAIIPLTFHDFVITTDGSNITAQFAAQGFFSAGE